MQPLRKFSRIYKHYMKKFIKITITLFLLLLVLSPAIFFLIYPIYDDLIIKIESLNIYNIVKKETVNILTSLSPSKDTYATEILGASTIEESIANAEIKIDRKDIEELNTVLNISTLDISGKIFQGETSSTMDKGFWHFPLSKNPGKKGNVVIIGHRFMNMPPKKDTFYNLDKVGIGDKIQIINDEGEYNYIVVEKKEVEPNDTSVIQDTDDYRLTLITCTPLWTSQKRLIVVAKLDKLYKKV